MAAVATALLVGLWARGLPFWLDEEMIAVNVRDRAVVDLVRPLWLGQAAPPGWLVLERVVLAVLGSGELAMRLVPLLFGAGTVVVAAWIAGRWLTRAGGVVLVALTGVSPWLIYHAIEMKPYSADAFWAMALPALAAWVLDAGGRDAAKASNLRLALWWCLAACGMWTANGALFVAPWCACVLTAALYRREGWRGVRRVAILGVPWLAAFGALYAASLRHALGSSYLQSYWAFAMPPADADPWARVTWIAGRLASLADKPGGSRLGIALWLAAAAGFVAAAPRTLAVCFVGVPVTAFVLAALRIVPLSERLSLWIVPALTVGVALVTDRAIAWVAAARRLRRAGALASASLVIAIVMVIGADIAGNSGIALRQTLAGRDHHELDDRAGVRWLLGQERPGDVYVTTHLALPALWWYGPARLDDRLESGSRMATGTPVLELGHTLDEAACRDDALGRALGDHQRLLIYLGFRFDDVPMDFDDQLLEALSRVGTVVAMRPYGRRSRALIVERFGPASGAQGRGGRVASAGCLTLQPAARW